MAVSLECKLSVAFLPGVRLSLARLSLSTELQAEVRRELDDTFGVTHAERGQEQPAPSARLLYSASSQSAETALPEPYWTGVVPLNCDELAALSHVVQKHALIRAESTSVEVSLYDFDVAIASLSYAIDPQSLEASSLRAASSSAADEITAALTAFCARFSMTLSSVMEKSSRLAPLRIQSFSIGSAKIVRPAEGNQAVDDNEGSARESAEREPDSNGALEAYTAPSPHAPLWNHALYVQRHDESSGDGPLILTLNINDFTLVGGTAVSLGTTTFVPGLHASLLTTDEEDEIPRVARVLDHMHAWWTSTWLLDQHLLSAALRAEIRSERTSLASLEDSAREFAEAAQIVAQLKARHDTSLLNLGALEWAIWQALAATWNFNHNMESIHSKSANAITAHNIMRAEISARQSQRFNRIAAVFTLIATLSSLIAVLVFLAPTVDDETTPLPTRIGILVVLALCGAIALIWSFSLALAARRGRPGRQRDLSQA